MDEWIWMYKAHIVIVFFREELYSLIATGTKDCLWSGCWELDQSPGPHGGDGWNFPEFTASEASVSPSLTPWILASPQWRHQLCGWVCWACLILRPSIFCPNTPYSRIKIYAVWNVLKNRFSSLALFVLGYGSHRLRHLCCPLVCSQW